MCIRDRAKAKDLAASMRLPSLAGTRMDAFLAAGVAKVARHQQGDGNFSLWPQSEPHPHLTVYALWGLREARRAGVDVPEDVLVRGRAALQTWIESGDAWKGGDVAVVAMAAYLFADAGAPDHGLIARLYDQRATMPRWRAWRGSSMLMNEPKKLSASSGMSGTETAPLPEQKSWGRLEISTTSA